MKYFILLLTFVSFFVQRSVAQKTAIIKLASARSADNSVNITFEKPDAGTVTVELIFKDLTNTSVSSTNFTANGYSGNIITLRPNNKEQPINYSYSFRSIRGKLKPKVNYDLVYLLPYPSETNVQVFEAKFLNASYFGNSEPSDWKVYHFYTDQATKVTAARKGIVVEVVDEYDDNTVSGVTFSSNTNRIMIEHQDGTLTQYNGFQKGSIAVKVGETVFPGEVLGVNVKREDNRYSIAFSVIYLKRGDLSANENKNLATTESFYGWVTPQFMTVAGSQQLTKNNTYAVRWDTDVITKEMSKKELKKYNTKVD